VSLVGKYTTAIVVAHLLVNIVHGLAHRELSVGLDPPASIFVIVVVLVGPLLAMALVWTTKKRIGLILLSLSMFGSLLFGYKRNGAHHHIYKDVQNAVTLRVWHCDFLEEYLRSKRTRLRSAFSLVTPRWTVPPKHKSSGQLSEWNVLLNPQSAELALFSGRQYS